MRETGRRKRPEGSKSPCRKLARGNIKLLEVSYDEHHCRSNFDLADLFGYSR